MEQTSLDAIVAAFPVPAAVSYARCGSGHIHDTYRVTLADGRTVLLQRINTRVFPDPDALMQNIRLVTSHLARSVRDARHVLTLIPAASGAAYARLCSGCWRMYEYVTDSVCFDRAPSAALFSACAAAFGTFVARLSDFDAALLTETIPHFHDTPARAAALETAVQRDACVRVTAAAPEIGFALGYRPLAGAMTALQQTGELPLRVTHNDTKINNVLFDRDTLCPLCVVDLDTVMPGLVGNDFGDAIRFGASTAAEDERDLSRVRLDLTLYEAYLRGFLSVCGDALTAAELETLPLAARLITYECGVRFLTDHLSGDTYFHTAYPGHNLVRARTQFALLRDMDAQWDAMRRIRDAALS